MTEDELNEFVARLSRAEQLALRNGPGALTRETADSLFEKGLFQVRPQVGDKVRLTEFGKRVHAVIEEIEAFEKAAQIPFMLKGEHDELLFKCHGLKPGMDVALCPSGENIMMAGPGSVVIGRVVACEEVGKWRVMPVKFPTK